MFHLILILCLTVMQHANGQLGLRVVGGTATTIDRYPILAQFLLDVWGTQNYIQHCAGVILTSRHVLSAAHCFQYSTNTGRNYSQTKFWKIRVGSSFRSVGGVLHKLKSIIPHPQFNKHYYTNDVAIVVVAKTFRFGPTIRQGTIMSHRIEIMPNSPCMLVGWGTLESDGPQPEQLQQAVVYSVDQDICRARYETINALIEDSMICAGRLNFGGVDSCFGDSGGPIIYKGLVAGLISFGYACGHPFYPGVYTKISHYTDWILQTVAENI